MKLWQFLKRWRQAYLDDKGDRLHAEAQVKCVTPTPRTSSPQVWADTEKQYYNEQWIFNYNDK